ncbi:XdhC family protein [uncultured Paracoccus sp.]|uniref:XdhC family protein n=1 Tax=uncultured Paracoccus sp. TaxID=189685 RepID=UPI0026222BB9|nr:XdhC family protein [uncultured Paracoccus sp.]
MDILNQSATVSRDPLAEAAAATGDVALAIITGVEGPSYRPVGAVMAVIPEGEDHGLVGTLSSGCVEADIAHHARQALAEGRPRSIRYGRGSPFIDIQLPCGGGLQILLLPRPDRELLHEITLRRSARQVCVLRIDTETGAITLQDDGQTGFDGGDFILRIEPELRFLVFGKGPEAFTFAALTQSVGYPSLLLSPDPETLDSAASAGCPTRQLVRPGWPVDLEVDGWTAILLFFHDHDWEPLILKGALETSAFYIGSQGSQRAAATRRLALAELGVSEAAMDRLHGPVGLIRSARDARTLAVSVLAEVLDMARAATPLREFA